MECWCMMGIGMSTSQSVLIHCHQMYELPLKYLSKCALLFKHSRSTCTQYQMKDEFESLPVTNISFDAWSRIFCHTSSSASAALVKIPLKVWKSFCLRLLEKCKVSKSFCLQLLEECNKPKVEIKSRKKTFVSAGNTTDHWGKSGTCASDGCAFLWHSFHFWISLQIRTTDNSVRYSCGFSCVLCLCVLFRALSFRTSICTCVSIKMHGDVLLKTNLSSTYMARHFWSTVSLWL